MINRSIIFLSIIIGGCVEPFDADIDLNSSYFVVTGRISDSQPAYVEIEKTIAANINNVSTNANSNQKILNANVLLIDDENNEELLIDNRDGSYSGSMKGKAGRSYHLEITLPDTRVIISTPQLIKQGAEIDDIFVEQSTRYELIEGFENVIHGLNLNVYVDNEDTISTYYKWTLNGTYEFKSPSNPGLSCYVNESHNGFFDIGESISNSKDLLLNELMFLEPNGKKFSIGYSMEVSQYTMTKEAHTYWKKIDDQRNNVGSVFDSPPARIVGNLVYVNDDVTPVLGFFEAYSIKKKRIFINPLDFYVEPELEDIACGFEHPPAWCSDCTALPGSTTLKPSFWP